MAKTPNVWFTSDHHFGHRNMSEKFVMADGRRVRHEFDSMEECDEQMILRWNERIPQGAKVYHLGDLSFSKQVIDKVLARLNGDIALILGNHDPDDPMTWIRNKYDSEGRLIGFERKVRKLQSWEFFGPVGEKPTFVACHYPVHPMCITHHHDKGRTLGCLHGHEHRTQVMATAETPRQFFMRNGCDGRYLNICVENHDYYPLHYDDVVRIFKSREVPT